MQRALPLLAVAALALGCKNEASKGASDETPPTSATTPAPEAAPAPDAQAAASVDLPLHLAGTIDVPGSPLDYFARIEQVDGELRGTLSIPLQGALDVDLGDLTLEGAKLSFTLPMANATWTATFSGSEIECAFSQRGMKLPCSMESITEAALAERMQVDRPQNPKPPFPYEAIDVEYENVAAGVKLAGTLTVPAGGPHPVALLITGSGAQDRDETIAGHKPFWVLADHLTRNGIAVLRVDDRGVGGSTGSAAEATMKDFADDVEAGIAFLAAHERIDSAKIGLIGHSEGGAIAPYVAARNAKVAFVVMLAGPGVSGAELLVEQVGALTRSMGADEAAVAQAKASQEKAMQILATTPDEAEARVAMKNLMDPTGAGGDAVEAQIDMVLSPWFRTFVAYDPAPTLKKLDIPVLAVNGSLDTQVVATQNLPAIERALAGNPKAEVVTLEGLNHLFQPATTGAPTEYAQIDETLDRSLLDLLTRWLGMNA
jgi:uncharacterized protein